MTHFTIGSHSLPELHLIVNLTRDGLTVEQAMTCVATLRRLRRPTLLERLRACFDPCEDTIPLDDDTPTVPLERLPL